MRTSSGPNLAGEYFLDEAGVSVRHTWFRHGNIFNRQCEVRALIGDNTRLASLWYLLGHFCDTAERSRIEKKVARDSIRLFEKAAIQPSFKTGSR